MKLNFSEIKNNNPVVFLYHAGSGGEFISKTFSEIAEGFHCLPFHHNHDTNQYHAISPLHYSTQWTEPDNPFTWMNEKFVKTENMKRFVTKDHITNTNMKRYHCFLPDAHYIYLYAMKEREHFAKLAFAKLSVQIEPKDAENFIYENVNDLISMKHKEMILEWASRYEWVWSHELMICNTRLHDGKRLSDYRHEKSLRNHVHTHVVGDMHFFNYIKTNWKNKFNNLKFMCIDELAVKCKQKFWTDILFAANAELRNELPMDATNDWICRNNELLDRKCYE